jgi:hypothetical protein
LGIEETGIGESVFTWGGDVFAEVVLEEIRGAIEGIGVVVRVGVLEEL